MARSRQNRFKGGVPQPHRAQRVVASCRRRVKGTSSLLPPLPTLRGSCQFQSRPVDRPTRVRLKIDLHSCGTVHHIKLLGDRPTCEYPTTATTTPPERPAPDSPFKTIRGAKNRRGGPRCANGTDAGRPAGAHQRNSFTSGQSTATHLLHLLSLRMRWTRARRLPARASACWHAPTPVWRVSLAAREAAGSAVVRPTIFRPGWPRGLARAATPPKKPARAWGCAWPPCGGMSLL